MHVYTHIYGNMSTHMYIYVFIKAKSFFRYIGHDKRSGATVLHIQIKLHNQNCYSGNNNTGCSSAKFCGVIIFRMPLLEF